MTPDIETVELRRHLRLLQRHRVLIAACTLLGAVVALAMSFIVKRTYAADVAMAISRSKIGEGTTVSETLSTANFRPLLESRAISSAVIKDMKLDQPPYSVSPNKFFGEVVEIEEVRNSSVILIHGRFSDPVLVADIVNKVADLGADTARRVSQREAVQARNDIKLQLDEAKTRFDTASANLDRARATAQLELSRSDVESELEQRSALLDLLINIEAEKARLAKAETELAKRPRVDTVMRSIESDPAMTEAARNTNNSPKDLLGLQLKTEEVNPVYQELDKQIASSRTQLAALEKQKSQMTARGLDTKQLARLNEMYVKESQISRLEMERDLAKKVYSDVANSYESARLLVAGRSSGLAILTRAIPPEKPESRKLPRNIVIGALSGFLLSALAVLVRGDNRPSIR